VRVRILRRGDAALESGSGVDGLGPSRHRSEEPDEERLYKEIRPCCLNALDGAPSGTCFSSMNGTENSGRVNRFAAASLEAVPKRVSSPRRAGAGAGEVGLVHVRMHTGSSLAGSLVERDRASRGIGRTVFSQEMG